MQLPLRGPGETTQWPGGATFALFQNGPDGTGQVDTDLPGAAGSHRRMGQAHRREGQSAAAYYAGGDIGTAFSTASLNGRLQQLQAQAGLDLVGNLSGHSFRVGAALDLLEQGESLENIMLRGGWQSESTVIRYLRAWQAA
jgi:hypothetical protein